MWLIQLKKNLSKLGKERPRKIEKSVSDWDNGTCDCVDGNIMPFKRNRWNMKVLAEKKWIPLL